MNNSIIKKYILQTLFMLATNKYMKKRRIVKCKYHPLFYNLIQPYSLGFERAFECKIFYAHPE